MYKWDDLARPGYEKSRPGIGAEPYITDFIDLHGIHVVAGQHAAGILHPIVNKSMRHGVDFAETGPHMPYISFRRGLRP